MKKRSKFIGIMLTLTLSITFLTTCIIGLNLSKYVKNEVVYSVEEKKYNANTNDTVFEEFKKADGTTYNFTPNIQTVEDLEEVAVLYGNYQFNHTGASSIVSMILRDSNITINDQWFSKCSTVSGLEWLSQFEDDSLYTSNTALKDPTTGKWMVRGNSSGGELKQYSSEDKIYKAYLVIGQKVTDNSTNNSRLLKEYPITLVGPNGKYIETKMENIREDDSDRYSAYMDVTEFVKEQGYGWYYCCNLPFLYNSNFSADTYSSWKLIVIEENTQETPLRALTLKLGLKKSSEEGVDVIINSSDIKSKATGDVTGQLLYSLEGADTGINQNFLKLIVDGTTYSDIYKETGSKTVHRTDALPMIEGFTRNNVPINNLMKFTSKADKVTNYTAFKYDNNGVEYTLAGPREGSDTELIDVDSKKTNTNVVIGNSKSSFKFNFSAVGCVLHANAMGLAVDIEGTEYNNDIKTEVTDEENSTVVVKGSSQNVYGDSESGLYNTVTTIKLDDDIVIDESKFAVTAYYQKTDSTEQIAIDAADITLDGNKVIIAWGDDTEEVTDLTLYGYTLTYEISGLTVTSGKEQYENEVIVTGKLYSSGIATDKEVGDLAKEESYVEYADFILQKTWLDNSNALGTRPDTITVELYRDGVADPLSVHEIPVDKTTDFQIYEIPHLLVKDDVKSYTYYIKEKEINLANGDKYVATIDGEKISNKLTGTTSQDANISWDDFDNRNDSRPDKVTVQLKQNGTVIKEYELDVNTENSYNFTDLPKYDENGALYEYTIDLEDIEGYTTTIDGNNILNKLNQLDYKVEYYYEGTINSQKTETKTVYYKDTITTYTDKNIDGYRFDKVDTVPLLVDKENLVIKVYYVKRTDFSYTVKYVNPENGKELIPDKVVDGQKFEDTVTEQAPDIPGYNKVNPEESITITTGDNIITFEYTKRTDLSYTVNYYEDGTTNKVANSKQVENQTFEDKITEQAIEIDGFYKKNPTSQTITIQVENNVINFYYTRRTDLEYTVKYIDPDDGTEVKPDKVVGNQTFDNKVTEQAPDIPGYNRVNPEETITITTGENTIIFEYTKRTDLEYSVEYYYSGTKDENKTEKYQGTFKDVIETYVDKTITGYELDKIENLPLTISAEPEKNVIKVYYKKIKYPYTVNYYYDGYLDIFKTETLEEEFSNQVTTYEEKLEYGYKFDKTENLPLTITTDPSKNIINVHYTAKDAQIIIKYLDKDTKAELEKETVVTGKVYDTHNLEENIKDVVGYTLSWKPSEMQVEFTEETQTFIFYYAKTTKVVVKYLEKDDTVTNTDNKVLAEEIIEGFKDLQYNTIQKDFENYVFAEATDNTSGRMTDKTIEVYYYYTRMVSGIHEKHIDVKSNEILDSVYHEVPVGEYYKIDSKEFEGYDVVTEKLPENAEGILTKEPIEVKYYYIRKAKVIAEYIDNATGEKILEKVEVDENGDGTPDRVDSKDSTVTIEGYEDDEYTVVSKEFDGYILLEEKLPENAEGIMKVTRDENGNIVTEIVVRYYYALETKVIEKHIDVKSNEVLEENTHEGYEGKEYSTIPKEFEGYDLVREQLPTNASGKMTKEPIEVKFYYIRKASVRVEHIDKTTGEIIVDTVEIDENGDGIPERTEEKRIVDIINGHEGDAYWTSTKAFEKYVVDKEEIPENATGTMEITVDENGNLITETVVRYYYLPKVLVIEKHIDIKTEEDIEPETVHEGYVGQSYKTTSKDFENYEVVEDRLPTNAEGVFEEETIIVNYYYIRKVKVIAEYIDEKTGDKIPQKIQVDTNEDGEPDAVEMKDSTEIIEGYEGDSYKTTAKEFEGYDIVESKLPTNEEGTMEKEDIYVRYYYLQKTKVIVEYIDDKTGEKFKEYSEEDSDGDGVADTTVERDSTEIIEGHEGDSYKTEVKEFKGYSLVEEKLPTNAEGNMTKEDIYVRYYYLREAKVIVEHIDDKTGEKILETVEVDDDGDGKADRTEEKESTVIIEGHEGDSYKATPKEFEDYELVKEKLPENSEGTMTIEPITVKYYYIRKTKVITEYINENTGEKILETVEVDENGDGKPEKIEEKDSTVIIEGHEGDSYKTTPKEFKGYELVKEKLPENAEGTMTIEPITVKYYYKRKAQVIVEYIEEKTGKTLKETVEVDENGDGKPEKTEEKDSTVTIEGYEGEAYKTTPKEFEGYELIKEKLPENAEGEFDEDVITVKYYYIKVIKVITEHIDEKTGEKIKETVKVDTNGDGKPEKTEEKDSTVVTEGHEGEAYKTTPKEFKNYDLVEEKLPKNSEGTIGEETITVKYYYIRKVKVTAEYIDERTGKTLQETVEVDENGDGKPEKTEEKDSTVVIEGHEGDSYKTSKKEFEGYDIVESKLPTNAEGTMAKEDIHIKYYYLRRTKVIVEYINRDTGKKFEETVGIDEDGNGTVERVETKDSTVIIEGHEGDYYKTTPKVFDGYKVVETSNNESGTMKVTVKDDGTVETTTYVRYYYSEKTSKVIVRYLERGTHKVLAEEIVKEGKPGEEYTTEAKNIELYTLEKEPENKNGVMTEEDIIVTYYYYFTNPPTISNIVSQIKDSITNNNSNNNSTNTIVADVNNTISTGDKVLITYTSIIIGVVFVNIIQIVIAKRKNKNIKK